MHPANTGHERCNSSKNRQKPTENYRFTAVCIKKGFGFEIVVQLQYLVFRFENFRAEKFSQFVVCGVSGNGSRNHDQQQ